MKALQQSATCCARTAAPAAVRTRTVAPCSMPTTMACSMDRHAGRFGGRRESQRVIERMQVTAAVVAQAADVAIGVRAPRRVRAWSSQRVRRVVVLVDQFVLVRTQLGFLPRLDRRVQVAPVQVAVDARASRPAALIRSSASTEMSNIFFASVGAHLRDQLVLAARVADDRLAAAAPRRAATRCDCLRAARPGSRARRGCSAVAAARDAAAHDADVGCRRRRSGAGGSAQDSPKRRSTNRCARPAWLQLVVRYQS